MRTRTLIIAAALAAISTGVLANCGACGHDKKKDEAKPAATNETVKAEAKPAA